MQVVGSVMLEMQYNIKYVMQCNVTGINYNDHAIYAVCFGDIFRLCFYFINCM